MLWTPKNVTSNPFDSIYSWDLYPHFTFAGITNPYQFLLIFIHLPHFFAVKLIAFILKYFQTDTFVNIQSFLQKPAAAALRALKEFFSFLIGRGAHSGQLLALFFLRTGLLLSGLIEVGTQMTGLVLGILAHRGIVLGLLVHGALVVGTLINRRLVIGG